MYTLISTGNIDCILQLIRPIAFSVANVNRDLQKFLYEHRLYVKICRQIPRSVSVKRITNNSNNSSAIAVYLYVM